MDEETEAEFKKAVSEWGIETPILCFNVNGELVLVDGKHRLDEVIARGDPQVDVVVREGDMVQVLTRNIYLDHLRGKHKVSDMIRVLKSLYEDYQLDTDQIAAQTYKNRDYVERLLRISQGVPEIVEAIDRGDLPLGAAEQVARLPRTIQQYQLLEQLGKFKLTVAEVKDFVDQVLVEMQNMPADQTDVPAPIPTAPPVYKCEACKQEVDRRFLAMIQLCPNCFGKIWRLSEPVPPVAPEPVDES